MEYICEDCKEGDCPPLRGAPRPRRRGRFAPGLECICKDGDCIFDTMSDSDDSVASPPPPSDLQPRSEATPTGLRGSAQRCNLCDKHRGTESRSDYRTIKRDALLTSLDNDTYARIARSAIHGVGVVAIRPIPKGILPFQTLTNFNDEIINLYPNEIATLPKNVQTMIRDFFLRNNDGSYPVLKNGLNALDISFFMNHSKTPNIAINSNINSRRGYSDFHTIRDISEGEELTFNYSHSVTPLGRRPSEGLPSAPR